MRIRAYALGLALGVSAVFAAPAATAAPTGSAPQPVGNAQTLRPEYPTCPPGKVVSKDDSEEAHYRYKAGKLEYDEANYSTAVTRFLAAYNLDCTKHELLVIISRSFDLAGNKTEAIRALELYLERGNVAPTEAASIRARIANMKKQLAENPPPVPTATEPTPAPETATATTQPSSTTTTPPPSSPPQREHTVYPWLVVGGGGLVLATGLVVYLVGTQTLPEGCNVSTRRCEPLPGANPTIELSRREKAGDAAGQQLAGQILMASGGAILVGGLVWHFLEPTGPVTSRRPTITPTFGPGYAGFGASGRF